MGIIVSLVLTFSFLFLKRKSMTRMYAFWSTLLVFYLSVLLSQVVGFPNLVEFNRQLSHSESLFTPYINRIPFSQGFDVSSFLNIVAFIPLGIALIVMWKKFEKVTPTILLGLSFSLLIEVGQLFTLHRQTDVNDLIMNTLGVLIGHLLGNYLFKWKIQRKNGLNFDWISFFLIAIVSVFIFG